MKRKYSFRKFFNDVHLWLGIGSGLILFVVCLSGTIYTFRTEIEHIANPSKFYAGQPDKRPLIPVDQLVVGLEKKFQGKLTSLTIPGNPAMNYQVMIKTDAPSNKKAGKGEQKAARTGVPPTGHGKGAREGTTRGGGTEAEVRPKAYFVNPYTGAIAGEQGGGTTEFFATVMKLHRWLLLDTSTGRIIVGAATLVFVFLLITGFIIWFPRRIRNWRQGLTIKFSANWKRINHDLHNALGFYAFVVLLVMALTGLCWSFEWYKDGLSNVLGAKVFKGRGEKPLQSEPAADRATTVPLTAHINRANALFPYAGDLRVSLPAEELGAVSITKNQTGFFALSGPDKVQFDRFTGNPLKLERFADKPFNQKVADSIKPLHTGEIYGLFSKILYFIACLIATSLPVTGTIIWINKLKKKRKTKMPGRDAGVVTRRPEKSYEAEIGIL